MTGSNGSLEPEGPENPEPSHVVLNYGCSKWRSSSQQAADIYSSGEKLWTKEDLRDIENQLAQSATIKEFTVRRIDGRLIHVTNPNFGVEHPIWEPRIEYRDYWLLVKEPPEDSPDTYNCSYLPRWRNQTLLNFRELATNPDLTLQEIKHSWNNSRSCQLLRTYIETYLGARKVTKIVCFGIGDMCRELPEWMTRDKISTEQELDIKMSEQHLRMVQHSIALTLADVCSKLSRNPIRVLAQDPDYTMQSCQILSDNGFEIVGRFGAGGFSEIDGESIVFSPFASAPVKQILADTARPVLVISDGFGAFNDHEKPWADADSPRTKQMWDEYQNRDFPTSSEDTWLNGSTLHKLKLYLRTAIEPVPDR